MMSKSSPDESKLRDALFITLFGEYDISRAAELDRVLSAAHASDAVVIDFRRVAYVDSTVLMRLMLLKERMTERGSGELILQNVSPMLMRIFEVSGLKKLFEFRSTD
jgi:anti-anti-sigma factor